MIARISVSKIRDYLKTSITECPKWCWTMPPLRC